MSCHVSAGSCCSLAVYHSADALEVVINALAIAFIAALDDEYKSFVFKHDVVIKQLVHTELQIVAANRDELMAQDRWRVKAFVLMLAAPIIPMAGLSVYVPLCM